MAIKEVTLADLRKLGNDQDIWVLNSSADSILETQGEVIISVPKEHGNGNIAIRIEQTWLPQRLTEFATAEQILRSSEILEAARNKLITLITPDSAKEILAEDGADEEKASLAERKRLMMKATQARTIADSKSEIKVLGGGNEETVNIASVLADADVPQSPVEAKFEMLIDRLQREPDIKVFNDLKSRRNFKRAEVLYMLNKFHDKPKTMDLLNKTVAAMEKAKKRK